MLDSGAGRLHVGLVAPPWTPTSAWIRADAATLTRTPYRLVIDTAHTRLLVFREGRLQFCAPAGLGSSEQPTPLGHHFVVLLAQSPNPGYGPFVIVTSTPTGAHVDWQQDGRPIITIAGPLDTDAAIGATGARITKGSVRLHAADLARLRDLPAGTPIDVVTDLQLQRTTGSGKYRHQAHQDAVNQLCQPSTPTPTPTRP